MPDPFLTADHDAYRDTVRQSLRREVHPHYEDWEANRLVDRSAWKAAGANGIIGLAVPEQHGGAGEPDYRYRVVVAEEMATTALTSLVTGFAVQDDAVLPYVLGFATAEQRARWLPGMASTVSPSAPSP